MEQPISSDLIRGHIDTIILHTLLSSDKTAQQIIDSVELDSDKKYQLNQATLYSSLKRLEKLKYLNSYWYDYDKGRRKFFQITESGKNFVNENLVSWTFSRSIIDKLVGYEEPKPVISPVFSMPIKSVSTISSSVSIEKQTETVVTEKKVDSNAPISLNEKIEVNYRNVLNGLISYNKVSERDYDAVEKSEDVVEVENVKKFNETIEITDDNIEKSIGEIDYSDIVAKGEKDGIKVRVSSKDSAKQAGNLYCNKLSFSSMLMVFILSVLELIVINARYGNMINGAVNTIATILCVIFPVYFGVRFFLMPKKSVSTIINTDEIITSSIVIFNLIVIIVAFNFVLNVNVSDVSNVVSFVVMPIIACLNAVLYFVVKFFLSKQKRFYVNK